MLPSSRLVWLCALGTLPLLLVPLVPGIGTLVLAFDMGLLVLCLVEIALGPRPRDLTLVRRFAGRLHMGVPCEVGLTMANRGRSGGRILVRDHTPEEFLADPTELETRLPEDTESAITYSVTPLSRGEHEFGATDVRMTWGLGLVIRRASLPIHETARVYPDLTGIRRYNLARRTRRLAHTGLHLLRQQGKGAEFERLRDYTPDDEYRDINWKATAKRRRPVTQVYQTERSQNVLAVLDYGRTMGGRAGDRSKLDHAIEAALLLCHAAMLMGDKFGLLAFGARPEIFIPPKKGRNHFHRILESVVGLQPLPFDVQYRELFRFIAARHRRRSLTVLFTDLGDEEAADQIRSYLPVVRRSHLPLCVSISDPRVLARSRMEVTDDESLYMRGAAMEVVMEREMILADQRRSGALVIDKPPEEISVAAVNRYLDLKARQMI